MLDFIILIFLVLYDVLLDESVVLYVNVYVPADNAAFKVTNVDVPVINLILDNKFVVSDVDITDTKYTGIILFDVSNPYAPESVNLVPVKPDKVVPPVKYIFGVIH
jgi:hypothetical protein